MSGSRPPAGSPRHLLQLRRSHVAAAPHPIPVSDRSAIPGSPWHRRQAPCLVRHQLQVDECGPDRRVSQPATKVVDRDATDQEVTGVVVPEGVTLYVPARRDHTRFNGPCGRAGRSDEPVLHADVAELQRAGEGNPQLGQTPTVMSQAVCVRVGTDQMV